jgi:hypothetical protein
MNEATDTAKNAASLYSQGVSNTIMLWRLTLEGDNSLSNCRCICVVCHRLKTSSRAPVLAKVERNWRKDRGIRPRSRFAGSKDSPFKKKIDGRVVKRNP